MTNIAQTADSYPEGVYLLAVTDPVLGGPEGFSNKAAIDLANRTAYQRMRNVTPWRAGLENPYPAHAYVHHAGVTWKSLVANANVEPGTDATKWIRWGYTSAELAEFMAGYLPYGTPPACPNTGPIGAANKAKIYKSVLNEYWMWKGDGWRVTADLFSYSIGVPSIAIPANTILTIAAMTMPRSGRILMRGLVSNLNAVNGGNTLQGYCVLVRGGVATTIQDSYVEYTGLASSQYMSARPIGFIDVLENDQVHLLASSPNGVSPSPLYNSGLFYQYVR